MRFVVIISCSVVKAFISTFCIDTIERKSYFCLMQNTADENTLKFIYVDH